MRTITVVFVTVVVVLALVWLGLVGIARSGAIDVAATHESLPGVDWFFNTLTANSIERQAAAAARQGLAPPEQVTAGMIRDGSSEYAEMCVTCHGAPGVEAGAIGKGLHPEPPDLRETAREMEPGEIYWVLQHGIRHSGMPAFGPTHGEEELWATAFFVDRLASMTPEEYQRFVPQPQERPSHMEEHEHGEEHERGEAAPGRDEPRPGDREIPEAH